MGRIASLEPSLLQERIAASNVDSLDGVQRYVVWENQAVLNDYEFIPCQCRSTCWCRRHDCRGHYRIRRMPFDQFLDRYVQLWAPPRSRRILKKAVLENVPFKGRQANAVGPLQWLKGEWDTELSRVRAHVQCGLCDAGVPAIPMAVTNLYQAKMWAQLYYDCIVPFDTASRAEIKRWGYADPARDLRLANEQLFKDVRHFGERHGLTVSGLRELDQPWIHSSTLQRPEGSQPLSRVLDTVFYTPRNGSHRHKPPREG